MSFRMTASLTAALFLVLAVLLVAFPAPLYAIFALDANPVADFMARRTGAGFAGLFVLCFLARQAEPGPASRAIATGMTVAMLGFAVTGAFEALRGFAGPGIWVPTLAELVFAGLWSRHIRG